MFLVSSRIRKAVYSRNRSSYRGCSGWWRCRRGTSTTIPSGSRPALAGTGTRRGATDEAHDRRGHRGIGRQLLEQAVAAGHDVTAVVRNPKHLPGHVRVVTADLAAPDPAALASAVAGADAVLSGLGPRSTSDAGVASRGTRAIVQAMQASGVRRIVVVSAAPIGTVPSPGHPTPPKHDPGDGLLMRHLLSPLIKAAFRKPYADLALMEDILRDSGLDWTVVRPPRLTDRPPTGAYRTAARQNLRRGLLVARADVADLMLRVLDQPETINQVIGIAN